MILFITVLLLNNCQISKKTPLLVNKSSFDNQLIPSIQVTNEPRYYTIDQRMQHYQVPGMSIALIKNGQLVESTGYGYAQKEKAIKVRDNTLFKVGSISKSVTAILVMKLVEKGILDLDENVNNYLTTWKLPTNEFTNNSIITLRMLLGHTAGIQNINSKGYPQGVSIPNLTDQLNGKGNTPPLTFESIPGTRFKYANPGYLLIEQIIEDATNQSFSTLAKELIFDPLEMTNSSFDLKIYHPADTTISYAYDKVGKEIDGYWYNSGSKAVGGLWSTATDLAKLYLAVQRSINQPDSFLSNQSAKALITKHQENYGLGFYLKGEKEALILSHSGKSAGYTVYLTGYAHQGNGVIILTNADKGGYLFSEILRGISKENKWDFMQPKRITSIELSQKLLDQYSGVYKFEAGTENYTLALKQVGKHLQLIDIDEEGATAFTVRALTDTTFIDINEGDTFVMRKTKADQQFLIWNKSYEFKKVE